MNYESPEVTALTPAIDAIQGTKDNNVRDSIPGLKDPAAAYEDWE
jgi:hypothetical protein